MRHDSIEIIGLSGVGKTTLFYSLGGALFHNLDNYSTVHPIKPSKIRFFFETLKLITKVAISFGFVRFFHILRLKGYIGLFMKLGYRIASIKARGLRGLVYLRDSGVLMPLLSSVIDDRIKIDDVLLLKILSDIPLPKYVYCITDSPNNIYNRFIDREKSLGNNVEGYVLSDFINADTFLFALIKILKNMGTSVVVIKNNNLDYD
jgi:GTPase SAR1 family protein